MTNRTAQAATETIPAIHVLDEDCSGPHGACGSGHEQGRPVHLIPAVTDDTTPRLVLPTYHFTTVAEGVEAITRAYATAPTITTDEELYAARRAGIAHLIPRGWIDPSRR